MTIKFNRRWLNFLFFAMCTVVSNAQTIPGIQSINSFEEKNTKRNDLNREISQIEAELSQIFLKDTIIILENINSYSDDIKALENRISSINDPKDTTRQNLQKTADYYKQMVKRFQSDLVQANSIQKNQLDLKNKLLDKKNELNKIENDINVLLMPKIGQQNFMFYSSIAFVLLMSILLGTFYYVVKSDDQIRRTIFGGESGIQFIALFSIIIAIILFGLTGVLEGKELSALLGSVAGYILGKAKFTGENMTSSSSKSAQTNSNTNTNL